MMDWSSRSRTCNRCSRSPAATPQSPDYGQRFAARWVSKGSAGRGGAVDRRMIAAVRTGRYVAT